MRIDGKKYRTIWVSEKDRSIIQVIDQRRLPFEFSIHDLSSVDETIAAISDMVVRGAPLIGVTAAYGIYLATIEARVEVNFHEAVAQSASRLKAARPTAVNLSWGVDRQLSAIQGCSNADSAIEIAFRTAGEIADKDVATCRSIGEHGLGLIEEISRQKSGEPVNILTHCNAGWLACVDYGTATSPIYLAHEHGIPLHIWVDETRPRNQGSRLTAYELGEEGVPHTVIVDNAGGHLMQHGMVDMVIVGCDRVTMGGDVCNKIGTYLKALAAHDNNIPFYVALPSTTIDWSIDDGLAEIPIEERSEDEVRYIEGDHDGRQERVMVMPRLSSATNYGFDVTPARLVTGLITERGICEANREDILSLFGEKAVADE